MIESINLRDKKKGNELKYNLFIATDDCMRLSSAPFTHADDGRDNEPVSSFEYPKWESNIPYVEIHVDPLVTEH
jgi:hypothetical protein